MTGHAKRLILALCVSFIVLQCAATFVAAAVSAAGPQQQQEPMEVRMARWRVAALNTTRAAAAQRKATLVDPNTQWDMVMDGFGSGWQEFMNEVASAFGQQPGAAFSGQVTYDPTNNLQPNGIMQWWEDFVSGAFVGASDTVGVLIRGITAADGNSFSSEVLRSVDAYGSYAENAVAAIANDLGATGSLTVGGGAGGGLQVYDCKNQLIADMGVGYGFGLSTTMHSASVGAGGGGGITVYVEGEVVVQLGGGAGGGATIVSGQNWRPSVGSNNDPNQIQKGTVTEALELAAAHACRPFNVVGGGSCGGGMDVAGPYPAHYGGGYVWSQGTISGTVSGGGGSAISGIVVDCNNACVGQTSYQSCFCPCFQSGALKAGLSWASQIQCQY